jgi:aldehyde dehydrogenase (NAD+)
MRCGAIAAKAAFVHWSQTRVDERLAVLQRMRDAMAACQDELLRAIIQEYGAPHHALRGWLSGGGD